MKPFETMENGTQVKSLLLEIEVQIDVAMSPEEKAKAFYDKFDEVIKALPEEDQKYIYLKHYLTSEDPPGPRRFVLFCNQRGARVYSVGWWDDTGEEDRLHNQGSVREWWDGESGLTPHWELSMLPEEPMPGGPLTEEVRFAIDLSGAPAGGVVHLRGDGETLFLIDTYSYPMDPIGLLMLEADMANLLSQHPMIEATLRDTPLLEESDSVEEPFDGTCVEILDTSFSSVSIQVIDPGITLHQELIFELEDVLIGRKHCESTENSTGHAASVWVERDAEFEGEVLLIEADNVPEQFGIFFAGPNEIQIPFGNAFRCVGGGVTRLTRPEKADDNQASAEIEIGDLPLELSDEFNLQYWFRDPIAGGSNFSLSDAINVVL